MVLLTEQTEFCRWTFWYFSRLDSSERAWAEAFLAELGPLTSRCGSTLSPILITRIDGAIQELLTVRRLIAPPLDEALDGSPANANVVLTEAAGKARDRLRKALNELEGALGGAAKGRSPALAEAYLPILNDAAGVLEASLTGSDPEGARIDGAEEAETGDETGYEAS